MRSSLCIGLAALVPLVLGLSVDNASAQVPTPDAGLTPVQFIPIPNWSTSGPNQGNFDLLSFNPATRVMYVADRVNHGATAIDTGSNTVLGTVVPPGCATGAQCPSGVLVVPDLQKLVITDRRTNLYVYDLLVPGPPAIVTVPNGTDEMDYDPIHRRIYVANTSAPFFLTGIDLVGDAANTVVAQIPLANSPEQPRFNPVNGLIYLNVPEVGVLVIDPAAGTAGTGNIVTTFAVSDCGPAGLDIDPVTNTAILGCGSNAQALMDLNSGVILSTFPQITTTDVEAFNRNTRRWYTGSGNNRNTGVRCPMDSTGATPVVGVFAAQSGTLVGATCSGRNGHGLGIDPFQNNIYVGARQYPADPANADSGKPGVLVFHDPAPPAQTTPTRSQALLNGGVVSFALQGRVMSVQANKLQGFPDGPATLIVTTTVGNETVPCFGADGNMSCAGGLMGDPMIGGMATLASGGAIGAQGLITAVAR